MSRPQDVELRLRTPSARRDSGDSGNMRAYSSVSSGRIHDGTVLEELDRRTVRKLDFILLPFLSLLFLFNSLDKSNVSFM